MEVAMTSRPPSLNVTEVAPEMAWGGNSTSGNVTGYNVTSSMYRVSSSALADEQLSAFFYIVAVLLFYSVSIVMLMIKYIKREEQECELTFYYTEFVKREHLKSFAVDPRTSSLTSSLGRFNDRIKTMTADGATVGHQQEAGRGNIGLQPLLIGLETTV